MFHLPGASDLRFQWVQAWMSALDPVRMEEMVVDAWRMVVPKRVAAAYVAGLPDREQTGPPDRGVGQPAR